MVESSSPPAPTPTETIDPFSCFGDEEDEILAPTNNNDINSNNNRRKEVEAGIAQMYLAQRDPNNGVMCFKANTEISLMHHVRQSHVDNDLEGLLRAVDEYCEHRHWMMHIGPKKGKILERHLLHAYQRFCNTTHKDHDEIFRILELGTYCGYSSIFIIKTLLTHNIPIDKIHLYTVEVNEDYAKVARELIHLAGLSSTITVTIGTTLSPCLDALKKIDSMLNNKHTTFNFVFLDHEKDAYLRDIKLLEEHSRIITQRTVAVADNVIFAQCDDYIDYMRQKLLKKAIEYTETVECLIEYCESQLPFVGSNALQDGMQVTYY